MSLWATALVLALLVGLGGLALLVVPSGQGARRPAPTPPQPSPEPAVSLPSPSREERPPAAEPPPDDSPAGEPRKDAAPLGEVIRRFSNPEAPVAVQRSDAWRLAAAGTPEAMAALRVPLAKGPAHLEAAVAEALGRCKHPDARPLMLACLKSPHVEVVRAALRGLAATGDPALVNTFEELLDDPKRPDDVRAQAAAALGSLDCAASFQVLAASYSRFARDDELEAIAEAVLEGLATLPFARAEAFFKGLLDGPEVFEGSRIAALEALSHAGEAALPLLLKHAADDKDPAARAAAAWAIAAQGCTGAAEKLLGLIPNEKDPFVRERLWGAVRMQTGLPPEKLWDLALAERSDMARLTAFECLARLCHEPHDPEWAARFDLAAVPELLATALAGDARERVARQRAAAVLRLARTPEARKALDAIAEHPEPPAALRPTRHK